MQRWRGLDDVPADWGRCVVTIGVFDGIHRGHAELIRRAVEEAADRGIASVLLTFDPHPSEVIRPGSHPAQLSTLHRRADLAEELGIDVFCVIPFTPEVSKIPPERFVHEILVERLHAAEVVVGDNFTFGHKAVGDVAMLKALGTRFGFGVQGVSLLSEHAVTVSSTYIRSCVDAGDVALAREALGRPHRVEGVVVRGERRGRDLGYPTANIDSPPYSAIPADGVYAAWFTLFGYGLPGRELEPGRQYPAAVSVGTNPTFSGRNRTVEVFVLDADADLYGQHVGVDFVRRLRPMRKYDTVDALIEAMADDVEQARQILAADRA
ncbi:bifunctional riboflavin kinase/FAD synthetase [Rhodococcus sp. D2-41]|uniref:Riboflavin biosynthesis protein n=1 Tax=Speluncibacter jeojiensis TaxID=2710754 RepID=A0A9X4RCJ7_9ACTN|nr:bifunctional riboflavin kinase/FAD synthetase [Rhodococcus sp. D2-41]MDG3010935.1 bifunctional riboflavin kinase/FAD synthetase [Rhodococcus sp. D2-41]MDG3013910.1 bifunctional riboflavin kinase/FAD synthetase [Corynebacteriales bacterium D3-21]